MSQKEDARFKEWIEATRAKLDPSVHKAFDALVEHDTSKEIFRGHLREDEFYRNLQVVKDDQKKLKEEQSSLQSEIAKFERQRTDWVKWYNSEKPKNEHLNEENTRLQKELELVRAKLGKPAREDDLGSDDGDASPRGSREMNDELKAELAALKEELKNTKSRVETIDGNIPAFTASAIAAAQKAQKEGFDVDANQIVDLSLRTGIDPNQAYYQLTYEQRAKRAAEEQEKAIKDAEERGRRKALTERPSPDHIRPAGPSVIERLRGKTEYPTKRQDIVDAAVEEFRRLSVQ